MPPDVTGAGAVAAAAPHGIEVAVEFKPVEHPIEPLDNDQPIQCPLPEPSILNVSLILVLFLNFELYYQLVSIFFFLSLFELF